MVLKLKFHGKKLFCSTIFFFKYNNKGVISKGPVTFPTIVVLSPKVESNEVIVFQFFMLIPNLASDLSYVAFFGGKSTSKFGLLVLFEGLALGCSGWI